MLRLTVERLIQMIIVIIIVTLAAFVLVNMLNGNIVVYLLGDNATPANIARLTHQLNLDQPLLLRYLSWLGGVLHGDLGTSIVNDYPVVDALKTAIPATVTLMIGAQIWGILLALLTTAASIRWRWADRIVTGIALLLNAVPPFVVSLMLIIVFATTLHLLPSIGWVSPERSGWGSLLRALLMPSAVLGLSIFPEYMRVFRSDLRDQLEREEYVTLAWMKGLRSSRVFSRHIAPNSVGGFISLIATTTAHLLSGVVIVEQIFAIPGIGKMMLSAISQRDTTTLEGGLLTIVVFVVVANLVGELIHMRIDPRVRANAARTA